MLEDSQIGSCSANALYRASKFILSTYGVLTDVVFFCPPLFFADAAGSWDRGKVTSQEPLQLLNLVHASSLALYRHFASLSVPFICLYILHRSFISAMDSSETGFR